MIIITAQESSYENDSVPDGPFFEQQGKLSVSGHYLNNQKTGNWITYFDSGQINIVENYKNGQKNGLYLKISKRGYIEEQSEYLNDSLSGKK